MTLLGREIVKSALKGANQTKMANFWGKLGRVLFPKYVPLVRVNRLQNKDIFDLE